MPVRIPIFFLDDQLQTVSRPHQGRAMASVGIIGASQPVGSLVNYRQYWALIDTGADLNCAEVGFLDSIQAPRVGLGEVIGVTSRAPSYRRTMTLVLGPVDASRAVVTDVMEVSSAHHDRAKPYDVVLGNLFLECGVLHMDYVNGEYWFDYYGSHKNSRL